MMMKKCLFFLFLISETLYVQGEEKFREVDAFRIEYRSRREANAEFEESLKKMRDKLQDPYDEEHDKLDTESDETHAREWSLQLKTEDDDLAKKIAEKYGFDRVRRVLSTGMTAVYRFRYTSKRTEEAAKAKKLAEEQETERFVSKRDHIEAARNLAADDNVIWHRRERVLNRVKKNLIPTLSNVESSVEENVDFNDPEFHKQWYILNVGQTTGPKGFDDNVEKVWKRGYTGKNVVVSVLDDGIDHKHPDLIGNYEKEASYDMNDDDPDPAPNDKTVYNAHGTKCAGTIAASANNSICGVGIAFNAKIGGIRMLDGKATDSLEAASLSFHHDKIDIYSCSWGPKDNGQTFGRPGILGRMAFQHGAYKGRNGLGSIFVWATGNGGQSDDDCNADGYVNSIYTLGIGAVNEHSISTYYGEKCSAMFAVTYCSGPHSNMDVRDSKAPVITTFLYNQCTEHFVGTSSAAPLAAGIIALVVEANPKLSWRDVQHLVYHTAKQVSPEEGGWMKNGQGRLYNHKFGFGLLDADALVTAALTWKPVGEQKSCHFRLNYKNGDIPKHRHFKLKFATDGCQTCNADQKSKDGNCKNSITKLEHVLVNVTLKYYRRGDLSIDLVSPSGTVSHLLHNRKNDCSSAGLKGWSFKTLFNWDENPKGTWTLIFKDRDDKNEDNTNNRRDLEVEYAKKLDEVKKKEMEKRRSEKNDEDETYDDETEETMSTKQVHDFTNFKLPGSYEQKKNYKRDYGSSDKANYDSNAIRGYESVDDYLYRRLHNERFRRTTDNFGAAANDEADEQVDKKSFLFGGGTNCQDATDTLIAGEVMAISVTFYGTS